MCFVRIAEQKRLFPYTALNDWFLHCVLFIVCLLRGTDCMYNYSSPYCLDAAEKCRTAMTKTSAD